MRNLVLIFYIWLLPFLSQAQLQQNFTATGGLTKEGFSAIQATQYDNVKADKLRLPARILPVSIGMKVGVNFSNTNFNKVFPKHPVPVVSSWKPGYSGGILVEVHFSKKFSIQQEYLFSRVGGEVESLHTIYKHNYASLPVMLKYNVLPKFKLAAGLQFDLLIKAEEIMNGVSKLTTYDTEERSVGFNGGLEFMVSNHVRFNTRFIHGFNHIGIRQSTTKNEFKYEIFQLSIEYRL